MNKLKLRDGELSFQITGAGPSLLLIHAGIADSRMWVDGPHRAPDSVDQGLRKKVGEMQLRSFSHPEPDHVSYCELNPPAFERLKDIWHPVLIISGTLDVSEFMRLSDNLAEKIPKAKRIVVPGVAHMVSMEVPDKFNQIVLEFIMAEDSSTT